MDLVVQTPQFPVPGETLTGSNFKTFYGGKGANQATAIGKLGGSVGLLAKVGRDDFGRELIHSLDASGVQTEWILEDPAEPTGVALITVNSEGQNTIVVAPGSNGTLTPEEVSNGLNNTRFKILLVQLEIPMECVQTATNHANGSVLILNPAPARALSAELLSKIDYLTPNESEAKFLTGILPTDEGSCVLASQKLLDLGVKNVILTLGSQGSFFANQDGFQHFPAMHVEAIDTTGAGDAFNGAFAHFLASGESVPRSIELANIVGALSTTKRGAQASMPSIDELVNAQQGLS